MAEEKTGFDAKGIIGALGKFMRGLKDYNVFELLKILFALFVIALIVSFVRRPETFIEKVSYVFEMRENRLQREHANSSYRRAIADQNIRGYLKELRRLSGADHPDRRIPFSRADRPQGPLVGSYRLNVKI